MQDISVRCQTAEMSAEYIESWLVEHIAERLNIERDEIDINESFVSLGLQSTDAFILSGKMEALSNQRLPQNLLWHYDTIKLLAEYISEEIGEASMPGSNPPKPVSAEAENFSNEEIPVEFYKFELFEGYKEIQNRRTQFQAITKRIPYFTVHQGVLNDRTHINGKEFISFSGYNYLGMSGDPDVSEASKRAIDSYGTSVSASRLVSGEKPLHRDLEQEIADFIGVEDSIVYVAGHATNVSTIACLFGDKDLIVYDALIHDSSFQGCKLSSSRCVPFRHNDWSSLEEILKDLRGRYEKVLIILEGVYSMDGDIPELPKFIEIKQRYKALLMIDEAHSIGVLGRHGRGISEYFGINPADVDLWMGTLSKAFASCGGYIAGSRAVVEYLKYTSPGFVYSVGLPPSNAAASLKALRKLIAEPERVARLHERSSLFLRLANECGLNTGMSNNSPVIPIIVGDSQKCVLLSDMLFGDGINVQPMIYPSVENDAARLRFFITCSHTEEQIKYTVNTIKSKWDIIKSM